MIAIRKVAGLLLLSVAMLCTLIAASAVLSIGVVVLFNPFEQPNDIIGGLPFALILPTFFIGYLAYESFSISHYLVFRAYT